MSYKTDAVLNHVTDVQTSSGILTGGGTSTFFPDDIQTIKAKNPKVDFSKPELLKLLCYMEGELQARDVVIAVLKVCLLITFLYQRVNGFISSLF